MTKHVIPILFILQSIFAYHLQAQTFIGFQNSNYAGIYAIDLQPASIADSRLKYDVSLFGLNTTFSNSYISIAGSAILNGDIGNLTSDNYMGIIRENLNGDPKSLYLNYDIQLPGAMISLSPKHSIAFTSRWRSFLNVDGVEEPAARFGYHLLDLARQFDSVYTNPGMSVNILSYMEFGLNYSRVLYDEGEHFVKGGARLKLLSGLAGASAYTDSLRYSFSDDHTISVEEANISYSHSTVLDGIQDGFDPFRDFGNIRFNDVGFGLDLGVVYEYRPDHAEYHYGSGDSRSPMLDKNKYKFRVGLSLLDVGVIPFAQSPSGQNFSGSVLGYDLNQLDLNGVAAFDSVVQAEFSTEQGSEDFTMGLPTAFSAQFDLQIKKKFYINLTPYIAFKRGGKYQSVHTLTQVSLTPRWESKWFGLGVPISLSDAGTVDAGFMFRAGPFVAGSSNMTSALMGGEMKGVDFRFGLRSPFPHKTNRDQDPSTQPVKEPKEIASKERKPKKTKTRPEKTEKVRKNKKNRKGDKDVEIEDNITEAETPDAAVSTPATPEQPTTEQAKPEVASTPAPTKPATESPKPPVTESKKPAVVASNPAPEKTESPTPAPTKPAVKPEIVEKQSPAPVSPTPEAPAEQPPRKVYSADSIVVNKPEFSPERPFVNETTIVYLPYADADGDGIINKNDICPEIPGLSALEGCPPEEDSGMEKEYEEVDAFHRLYFTSGSPDLRPFHKEMLRQVAFILKGNPDATLLILAHTDASSAEKRNTNLALKRGDATRDYLIARGVPESQLIIVPHGEDRPASTNLSEQGRSLNRRVELVLQAE